MAAQGTLTAQASLTPKRPNKWASYFKRSWPLYAMLLPMIVYQLIFSYYPMLGVVIAFKDWRILGGIWGSPWASTRGSREGSEGTSRGKGLRVGKLKDYHRT